MTYNKDVFFEPKVLINAKRICKDSEYKFDTFTIDK